MRHAWDMGVARQHPSTSHNFIYLVDTNVFINSRGMLVYYSILLVVLFWSGNLLLSLEQHVCFFKYIMLIFILLLPIDCLVCNNYKGNSIEILNNLRNNSSYCSVVASQGMVDTWGVTGWPPEPPFGPPVYSFA